MLAEFDRRKAYERHGLVNTAQWLNRQCGIGTVAGREKVREEVVRKPVTKVVAVGTKQPRCDPNYTGACVPIASDVDCAGGSGNGPAYVEGPVRVVGQDIYGLDHDNDGIGCE